MELKEFVKKNNYLFWDVKKGNLSDEIIVEKTIDFWDLDQLRQLYKIMWKERFKKAFVNNLLDENGQVRQKININDYKIIYILAHRLDLENEIPLWDIVTTAKKTSFYNLKN